MSVVKPNISNNCMNLLFVCLGNICRSPGAEGVMRHLVAEAGRTDDIHVDSAGTAAYHVGEAPDARMIRAAARRGYDLSDLRARQFTVADFDRFDRILVMDDANYDNVCRLAPTLEAQAKVERLATYAHGHTLDHVPDPYYGGVAGFDLVLDLLEDACTELLKEI